MKNMKIRGILVWLFAFIIGLTGCSGQIDTQQMNKSLPNVYFYDVLKGELIPEEVDSSFLNIKTEPEKVQFILNELNNGSQDSPIPVNSQLPIKELNIADRLVKITFNTNYTALSAQERITKRAELVYSLTELNFIDKVEFYVEAYTEDQFVVEAIPLTNANGDVVGPVDRDSFEIGVLEPSPPTKSLTLTLYFANTEGKLVKEQRIVQVNNSVSTEKYIIDELIKGPMQEGLVATLPSDVTIKDVTAKGGVCQVDLSFDLKSKFFTSETSKELMIYSIVNSLTELSKIKKVAFLVDGKKEIEFTKDIDLRDSFERKEELIEPSKASTSS